MKKLLSLIAIAFIAALIACNKDELSIKDQYARLIPGTWKAYQQNTRVFDLKSNALLKDSTIVFDDELADKAWVEIFDADGDTYTVSYSRKIGATAATADTTSYGTYSILGTNLTIKQLIGGTQTKPIINIDATNLALQYSFTGRLTTDWGLSPNTTFKITQVTYYVKQ